MQDNTVVSREQLEARIRELEGQVAAKGVAVYETSTMPNGKINGKLTIAGCRSIFGSRAKFEGLLAEGTSGRLATWLKVHPEIK